MAEKIKASSRTVQWKSGENARVKCAHCGEEFSVARLDQEMHCPECDHQAWVMAGPESGERTQIPSTAN